MNRVLHCYIMDMEKMMERLLAGQEQMMARLNADLMAKLEANQAKAEAEEKPIGKKGRPTQRPGERRWLP